MKDASPEPRTAGGAQAAAGPLFELPPELAIDTRVARRVIGVFRPGL